MIRIAVSYKDGEIFEHFGHSEFFAIYEYDEHDLEKSTKRLVDTSAMHGHKEMADLMKSEHVDAVICGQMGDEARALLLQYGIIPVPGYCGDGSAGHRPAASRRRRRLLRRLRRLRRLLRLPRRRRGRGRLRLRRRMRLRLLKKKQQEKSKKRMLRHPLFAV